MNCVLNDIFAYEFDRNFEIFILWNSTARVNKFYQLEAGSDLNRAFYFKECISQLCSIKLCAS